MPHTLEYPNPVYDGQERRKDERRASWDYSQTIHLNPFVRDRRKVNGRRSLDQPRWPGYEI